jgi:hypothetical protein
MCMDVDHNRLIGCHDAALADARWYAPQEREAGRADNINVTIISHVSLLREDSEEMCAYVR